MDYTSRYSRRHSRNEPGHAHELTFSCYRRHRFFQAERTCLWLSEAISAARSRLDFAVWAYVFMPDHVHLLIYPRRSQYDISAILKSIKEPVGRRALAYLKESRPDWLPRLTRVRGGRRERLFWQSGGGYDRNVTDPQTLGKIIDYLHMNPVRRGLVERTADWLWSSAGWYEDLRETALVPDRIPPEWSWT